MYNKKFLICIIGSILVFLFLYSLFFSSYKKGNENTEIVLYVGSGEKIVYKNPDWYKFRKNGITFKKEGKRIIAGKNYEVIIHLEDE